MASQQHATRENIRKTSKALTWEQEEERKATKRILKGTVRASRERLTEALAINGMTYRERR